VQHLVGFFSNTMKNAAEDGETFLEGCEYVWEDLSFVDPPAMELILQIFARVFKQMKSVDFDSDLAIHLFLETQEDLRRKSGRLSLDFSDEDGTTSVDGSGFHPSSSHSRPSVRRASAISHSSAHRLSASREARLNSPARMMTTHTSSARRSSRRPSASSEGAHLLSPSYSGGHDVQSVVPTPSRMRNYQSRRDELDISRTTSNELMIATLHSDDEASVHNVRDSVRTIRTTDLPGSRRPTDDVSTEGASTPNSTVLMMHRLLEPVGLQHLAQGLADDDIDVGMLMKMSAIELKACGASMGKALKFVEARN